ncbi:MAG: M24 family metallopeptidase [Spirochaetota bacterium]
MPAISKDEFIKRIDRIQDEMDRKGIHGMAVYGDEYRKENLRYVSNFWPIFERGICFIPLKGQPILAGAPEGEQYAREMSVWSDYRNLKELACVSVPEEIDYPLASFSDLHQIIKQTLTGGSKLGLVGYMDIPEPLFNRITKAVPGVELVCCDEILQKMRLIKSRAEEECLKECGRIAGTGYKKLMEEAVPGNTELMAAGAAEGAARRAGAEDIVFTVLGSGERTGTIIGRPTRKVIAEGEMVMASFAVQYQGYVTTVEFPFVAGGPSGGQKKILEVLMEAANVQLEYIKEGTVAGEMVRAVKQVFRKHNLEKYDIYPPMHGIGLAEAESPYPDENSDYPFRTGMCVNSDISLFGHPEGSNRIEEGFVIDQGGPVSLTPVIRELCEKGL